MTGPALLDVVQDYALQFLYEQGVFDLGVVLKGGTSLRKFRAGNAGRFSTDLDFVTPDADTGELLLDTLDGGEIEGVTFRILDRTALRGKLDIESPLGPPDIPAKIEITPRKLWLPCEALAPIALPVHRGYEFRLPTLPAPAFEEVLAEKLAAWRRRRKIRDLYDLYWFGQGPFNEVLVRRVLVLKVWHDVVDDGLGLGPFDGSVIVEDFDVDRLPKEDIGLLAQPVEPRRWLEIVRARYKFVAKLDTLEREVARCNPGDRKLVLQLTKALSTAKH
jgi:hypothetical protein